MLQEDGSYRAEVEFADEAQSAVFTFYNAADSLDYLERVADLTDVEDGDTIYDEQDAVNVVYSLAVQCHSVKKLDIA